jgi:NADH-quinone oxidoreductase subunit J
MDALAFTISGLLSIVAALLVVTRKNPVYGTIYLVLFFIMISLDFLILRAPFLAVVQVLVYAGAIMVLFLFVIMLLNLTPEELRERVTNGRRITAGGISIALFILLASAIARSPTVAGAPDLTGAITDPVLAVAGETPALGEALFTRHALAFELASVLILVAIIGAIYLTKKRRTGAKGRPPTGLERQEAQRSPDLTSRAAREGP